MKNYLFFALFLIPLVWVGCERVEVVAVSKCSDVVGLKQYSYKIMGILSLWPQSYYVLADGRILQASEPMLWNVSENEGKYCEIEYVPGSGAKKFERVPRWEVPGLRSGSIGVPCPKEKCPELYSKSTGLPIPPPPTPTP